MRKLELAEIQQIELEIFDAFVRLCKQHGLSYQLAYGSLLGAVRHQGFIPWDDDIDLLMPREHYRKLVAIVNGMNADGIVDGRYRFADPGVKSSLPYHQTFMKIYDMRTCASETSLRRSLGFQEGVFIDVFSLEGMPDDAREEEERFDRLDHLNDMVYYSTRQPCLDDLNPAHPRAFLQNAKGYLQASRKPYRVWIDEYYSELDNYGNAMGAARACCMRVRNMDGIAAPKNNPYFPTIEAPFEGRSISIPKNYDQILRDSYGEYLQLPPKGSRKPSHDQDFFLK